MPRGGPMVEKVVRGRRLHQTDFLKLIVAIVRKHGEKGATVRDVAEGLDDPNWLEPENQRLVARSLVNLKNRDVITSPKRNVYVAPDDGAEPGVNYTDKTERQFIKSLVDRGGYGKLKHIAIEFGADRQDDDPIYQLAYRTLARSDKIIADPTRHGYYWLAPDLMNRIVISGRALYMTTLSGLIGVSQGSNDEKQYAAAQAAQVVKRVGAAVKDLFLLHESSIDDILEADPVARALMTQMWRDFPDRAVMTRLKLEGYDLTSGKEAMKLRADGATDFQINLAREAAEMEWETNAPKTVLDAFMEGNLDAHLNTPVEFIRRLADWFNVDPVALSRGVVMWSGKPGDTLLSPIDTMDEIRQDSLPA